MNLGKLLGIAVKWAPVVMRAVKTWVSPAERDARKRHEQIDSDYEKRKAELEAAQRRGDLP